MIMCHALLTPAVIREQTASGPRAMALCMKDRKYDKRHVWSKNHSGCLETSCHVRGPLRNKMATLGVSSDIDPSADPVPGQTMLPTVSLTGSDIPRAFLKPSI